MIGYSDSSEEKLEMIPTDLLIIFISESAKITWKHIRANSEIKANQINITMRFESVAWFGATDMTGANTNKVYNCIEQPVTKSMQYRISERLSVILNI